MRVIGARQHTVQFNVGIDPAGHPAEQLEDRPLLEDHAGVALLGLGDPRGGIDGQYRPRLPAESHISDQGGGVDERQQQPGRIRLVQSVVGGVISHRPDGRELPVLG